MRRREPAPTAHAVFRYLLFNGPATAPEIAERLRLPMKQVESSLLNNKMLFVQAGKKAYQGRACYIWSVWEE